MNKQPNVPLLVGPHWPLVKSMENGHFVPKTDFVPKCPKAASCQQQFHMALPITGLPSDMMVLNV